MNQFTFRVNETELELVSKSADGTAGNVLSDKCIFRFTGWSDYARAGRIAYFGVDADRLVPISLLPSTWDMAVVDDEVEYTCLVPKNVVAQLKGESGEIFIAVSASVDSGSDISTRRTRLYRLRFRESGNVEFYITEDESEAFLNKVSAALARLEGKSIHSALINAANELVITLENGTVFNLGNVKGDKGNKGDKGDKGEKGETGDADKVQSITVSKVGDKYYLNIAFKSGSEYTERSTVLPLMKGEKGDKGDTGEKGAKGDTGDKGDTGTKGEPGTGILDIRSGGDGILVVELEDGRQISFSGFKGDKGDPGTTVYSDLSDKPQINGVALNGNKTGADLGLQAALVSGTNLKTINGMSLLGSGNVQTGFTPAPRTFYLLYGLHRIYEAMNDGVYQITEDHYVGVPITGKTTIDENIVYKDSIFTINKATKTVYCFGRTSFVYTLTGEGSFTGGAIVGNGNKGDAETVVTGTDGKQYALRFTMAAGKPAIEYREVETNE